MPSDAGPLLGGYNAETEAITDQLGRQAYGRTLQLLSQMQQPQLGNVGMQPPPQMGPQMFGGGGPMPPQGPAMTQGSPQGGGAVTPVVSMNDMNNAMANAGPPQAPTSPFQAWSAGTQRYMQQHPRQGPDPLGGLVSGPPTGFPGGAGPNSGLLQNMAMRQAPAGGGSPQGMPQMPPQQQQPPMGMPPGGGGQMGQQGPSLDWRMIMQKVQQANPGAPPQVLAAAVDKFLPLMNQQSQMEWKEIGLQLREQQMQNQFLLGQGRLGNQQASIEARYAAINTQREQAGLPPLGYKQFLQSFGGGDQPQGPQSGAPGAPPGGNVASTGEPTKPSGWSADSDAKPNQQPQQPQPVGAYGNALDTARGIEQGTIPPSDIPTKQRGAINSQFVKDKFNLSEAKLEWQQATKMTQSLNGPQMTRWRSTALSVQNTIKDVKELGRQLDMNNIRWLNKLDLEKLIQTQPNSPQGKLAQSYIAKIAALRGEIANLEQGGYAPTQDAWEVAKEQIDSSFAHGSLDASLDAVNDIVGYRLKALNTIGGGRFDTPNPYMQPGGKTQTQSQPAGGAAGGGQNFDDRFKIEPLPAGQ